MAHFGAALAQDLINAGSPTELCWKQKCECHCQHDSLYSACTCSAFVHTAIICVTVWYYPAKSFPLSIRDAWPSLTSTCALFAKISTKVLWLTSVLCWPRVLLMPVDEMLGLLSCTGSKNMNAIVGMTLFTQFWYWCH